VTQHDRSQAAEISHSIKGSSSNFGAESFSEMARALESASKTEEIEDLLEKAHKLNQMGYRLVQELEKIVDKEQSRLNSEIRYSVLVVEDNNTDRYSIINALGSNNLNVAEARNGTQAIKICQEKLPDLILLDVNMPEPGHPEMDGFLACRKIKEIPGAEHLPILIITSMDDSKSINKAFSAGASDYITKPINLSVLQRRVKQLLVSSHSERQIQKLAYTDPLTGLPNRPYFVEHLSRELVNPDSRGLSAVIFMGLDGFKTINDALGHEIGDILLQSVSKRLKTLSKENVVLARTGGDEFSLLVKNVLKEEDIELFAQLIRYEVSQPYYINMETISVSSSIGISVFPTHGKTVPILMKRADTALYYAKKANSGHMFYKTDMSERATRRHKVTSGLQEAIRSDQLVLYYQPQFSVEGGKVIGAEALIRWNYNNALIFPDEFIPYAEESGLIHELGEWVVLNACRQLSKWCEKGYKGIRVSINISGEQLVDQRLLNVIEESLIQSKADPRCLEIEITESSLIKNPEKCSDALNRIRAKGIEIAIDDFGTGYNNLSNLESFPIDTMKIDKSFVMPINEGSNTKTVKGIIALAKHMGYKIVAEGIETEFQKNRFSEFGCDYLQGYFISKPITADEFERKFLRKMFSPRAKVALISSANRNKK
jgi:diguanylate cyclase (GGDEF)-like protein